MEFDFNHNPKTALHLQARQGWGASQLLASLGSTWNPVCGNTSTLAHFYSTVTLSEMSNSFLLSVFVQSRVEKLVHAQNFEFR